MYKINYSKVDGSILCVHSNNFNVNLIDSGYVSQSEIENVGSMLTKNANIFPNTHKVDLSDNSIIELSEQEVYEERSFGKILSEQERLEMSNKPTDNEVEDAKNTIRMAKMALFFANMNKE